MKSKYLLLIAVLSAGIAVRTSAQVVLSAPDTSARHGDTLTIPLTIQGLTPADTVFGVEAIITPSSPALTVIGVESNGTLSSGASVFFNQATSKLAIAFTTPLTANGILVNVRVTVGGSPGSTYAIQLSGVKLNEGTPAVTGDNGSVYVRYIQVQPHFPAGVVLGDTVQFSLSGNVVAPISWSTSAPTVGTIDSNGMFVALAEGVLRVRAVDGEGKKDSTEAFTVHPANYQSLTISLPDTSQVQTLEIGIPVRVTDVTGLAITSAQFTLGFNTTYLEFVSVSAAGTLTSAWGAPQVNQTAPGTLVCALAGASELSGSGTLLTVVFRVKSAGLFQSPLTLSNVLFNESISSAVDNGTFTPSAAPTIIVTPDRYTALKGRTVTLISTTGGTGPYTYSSSLPTAATVDSVTGTLTVMTRGPVRIVARDSQGFFGSSDTIHTFDFTAIFPDTSFLKGDSVDIPVVVGNTSGLNITAYQFRLAFDTSVVVFRGAHISGSMSNGFSVDARDSAGAVWIAGAGASALSGSGDLLYLRFTSHPSSGRGDTSLVSLSTFQFNEPGASTPSALPVGGRISIIVPNEPPVFTAVLQDTTIREGDTLSFTYQATDPDGDTVRFTLVEGPPMAFLDSISGILTLAASFTDAGNYTLTVHAHDGVLSSSTTANVVITQNAPNTRSLRLDGVSDRVHVVDSAPIHPSAVPSAYQVSGDSITVEAWVYLMGLPAQNSEYVFVARAATGSFGVDPYFSYALRVQHYGGAPRFDFLLSTGNAGESFGTTADTVTVETGRWYHLAGTYDGTTTRLYIDGTLKSEALSGGKLVGPGGIGFYIGGATYGYTQGLIDDVRLWNVTRGVTDIQSAKDITLQGNEPGLAGYWPLDSTYVSGTEVVTPDMTPNHNDLAVQFDAHFVDFPYGSTVSFAPTRLSISPAAVGGGYALTETPYAALLLGDGWPKPGISVIQQPAGSSISGDSLFWTPQAHEYGWFLVVATLTNSGGSITDTVGIFVEAVRRSANATGVDVSHRGKVGAFGSFGKGVIYNGKNGLFAGDFSLVDRNNSAFAGGLYTTQNSFHPLEAFADVPSRFPGFTAFKTSFDDAWEMSNRIGVTVTQIAHVKATAPDDKYTILEYRVVNTSGLPIDDLFAQMSADYDVGVSGNNLGGYDSSRGLTYSYENGGSTNSYYYGIQLLSHPVAGGGVIPIGNDTSYIRNTSNLTTFWAVPVSPTDTRHQLNAGPFTVAPNETLTVAFAYLAADSLGQLQSAADEARLRYISAPPTMVRAFDYAVTGSEYKWRIVRNGIPFPTVQVLSKPAAMTVSGDTLIWTPGDTEFGFQPVVLRAENSLGSKVETTMVFVEAIRTAQNGISLDVSHRGKLGAFATYPRGLFFNGKNGLAGGDFSLVDRNSNRFAGGLYSSLVSFQPLGGFTTGTSRFPGFESFSATFDDAWEGPNRIGTSVVQVTHYDTSLVNSRFVIVEYSVVNVSGVTVDDLFAQMTADFDIGGAASNAGGYDSSLALMYAYEPGGAVDGSYYGFQLLGRPTAGRSIFVNGTDPQYVRNVAHVADIQMYSGVPADIRNQLSVGPFTLAPSETVTVAFAFLAGADLAELTTAATQAKSVYGNFTTAVPEGADQVPHQFSLGQNYPNPFNPSTTIHFALPEASDVTIAVFNVLGQEVARLVEGSLKAGYQTVRWNASVPSGVYFYRMTATTATGEKYSETQRMILMK